MAWIDGAEDRIFYLDLGEAEVVDFFCNPHRFTEAFTTLEKGSEIEPNVWEYILEPISAGGIRFQGKYIVEYERDGNTIWWSSRDEENMKSEGKTVVSKVGSRIQVEYEETISTNLPIPKIAAKVFRPIVAHEVKKGINAFLDTACQLLEGQTDS